MEITPVRTYAHKVYTPDKPLENDRAKKLQVFRNYGRSEMVMIR